MEFRENTRKILDAFQERGRQLTQTVNSLGLPKWRGICIICVVGWIAIAIAIASVSAAIYFFNKEEAQTIKIAYVGRSTADPTRTINQKRLHALKHYLSELEKERQEWHFEVDSFYVDSINTREVWTDIANDTSYTFIVDNAWGENMMEAEGIIKLNRLPVISLNADKLRADPGKHTLFLGHSDLQPDFIATFIQEILNYDRIRLVAERNYSLTDFIINELDARGIDYGDPFYLDGNMTTSRVQTLMNYLAKRPDIPVILNTHTIGGARVS